MSGFRPQDCISGKISRLQRHISGIFRSHIKPFGVTNSQLSLLFVLSKHKWLYQKNLAEIVVLEKSSLKRNIDLIIRNGWAFQDEEKKISITALGKNKMEEILPSWHQAMRQVEDVLGPDGLLALNLLERKLSLQPKSPIS